MILPENGKVLISWTQNSAYSSRRHKVKDALIGMFGPLAAASFVLAEGDNKSEGFKLPTFIHTYAAKRTDFSLLPR